MTKYDRYYNWYFIGSSGDMSTFGGLDRGNYGIPSSLGGTAFDLQVILGILNNHPSSSDERGTYTHFHADNLIVGY